MLKILSKGTKCAVLIAPLVLASCGGSGGNTPISSTAPVSLSGVVVDGYLEKATVCLDTNGDKSCVGEASKTLTGAKGVFTLKNVSAADAKAVLLVETIPNQTVDLDNPGTPLTKGYTLTSPAIGTGSNKVVISPVTTMVQSVIENDPNIKTATEASNIVKQKMGLAANDTFDVMSDYVAASKSTTKATADKAKKIHNIAKVTASVLATNKANIATYAQAAGVTVQASYDALLADVVNTVLAKITTQVAAATDSYGNVATKTITTLAQSNAPTVTATTLAAKVAVNKLPATSGSLLSAISNGNVMSWLGSSTNNVNGVGSNVYYYGDVTLNTITGNTINFKDFQYNSLGKVWNPKSRRNNSIVLSPTGTWKLYSGTATVYTPNLDGSVTGTLGASTTKTSAKKINVSGKNIQQFLQAQSSPILQKWAATITPTTAVFRAGALAFDFTDTSISGSYNIRYWDNGGAACNNGQATAVGTLGNCDIGAQYWDQALAKQVVPHVLGDVITLSTGSQKMITIVGNSSSWAGGVLHGATTTAKSGTVDFYLGTNNGGATQPVLKGSGTWTRKLIPGTNIEIIRMAIPLWAQALNNNNNIQVPEAILAVQDGMVRVGGYVPPNSVSQGGNVNFNNIAITDILNNFTYK